MKRVGDKRKRGRDIFLPVTQQKLPVTNSEWCPWHNNSARNNSVDLPITFYSAANGTFFFSWKTLLVIHSIKIWKFAFFYLTRGGEELYLAFLKEKFIHHSFKIRCGFNYFIKKRADFSKFFLFFILFRFMWLIIWSQSLSFLSMGKKKNSFFSCPINFSKTVS